MNVEEREQWFECDPEEIESGECDQRALYTKFEQVAEHSRLRNELARFYCSLYYNRAFQGYHDGQLVEEAVGEFKTKLNENVIGVIVGQLAAKLAKQKPKPTVITDGADWALQQRAKQYDKYLWGVLHKSKAYELQRGSDLHMLLEGTGGIGVNSRRGQIVLDVVPPWELYVEPCEARYGTPQTLYREQFVPRYKLTKLYPKHKADVLSAGNSKIHDAFGVSGAHDADLVRVVTGWHLPSWDGADDGRVMVAIDNCILSSGAWTRPRFPIAFSRYSLAPEGFWGIGCVAPLVGLQLELNRVLTFRQEALHLLGAPFVMVESGSKIIKSHLSNEIGRIIEYTGTPPQVVTPSAISPESFQHGDRVKSSMFSQSALSEMASSGMKPAGLNSGKALRTYADMQDDNFHDVLVRREQQILDLAECILDELENLDDDGEGKASSTVVYVGPFGTEKLKLADVKIDRDNFVLRVQPTSSLSTTVSGRLEDLQDLVNLGIVTDPAELQELLQLPDLDTAASRRNSIRDLLLKVLEEKILSEGISIVPEPGWDLALAMKLCVFTRLRAQLHNAPKDRVQLLRTFEQQCIDLQNKAKLPPPAPSPTEGSVPPVDGQQPPTPSLEGAALPPEMSPIPGGQPGAAPI